VNKILSFVPLVMTMCTTFQVFAVCQQDDDHVPNNSDVDGPK